MNIVFVGLSGVPFQRRAIDIRLLSFANLFTNLNHRVFILNRFAGLNNNPGLGISENIKIATIIDKVPKNRLEYLFYTFLSIVIEPWRLVKLNHVNKISVIHIASGHFIDVIFYWVISKFIRARIVYHYCEYRAAFKTKSPYHILNGRLLNKIAPLFWHGAICISNFLVEKSKEINPTIRIIKVPPICDFNYFQNIEPAKYKLPYLLFCGSVNFNDAIELIINSFHQSKISQLFTLKLVLSGNQSLIDELQKSHGDVEIYKDLEYSTLISMYKGALGLLIPLRNTIQDEARFPNKVCEYLASEGVILSTNFGEMKYYFKDGVNAIIADKFEVNSFSQKMDWLTENLDKMDTIRENAYDIGRKHFDTNAYAGDMAVFFSKLFE